MESKNPLKLNLDAKPWKPKWNSNATSQANPIQKNTPLNPNAASFQHTSLRIDSVKPFIPKNRQAQLNQPKPKVKKVDREYFVIDEDDNQTYSFDYDYMISFEKWEICQEDKLLTPEFLKHLEDFKIMEAEPIKQNNMNNKGKKKYYGDKKNKDSEKKKNYHHKI